MRAEEEEVKEFVAKLGSMGARSPFLIDKIAEEVMNLHPTIQQRVGGLIGTLILRFAELDDNNWGDLRNECVRKMCVKLREVLRKEDLAIKHRDKEHVHLPCI